MKKTLKMQNEHLSHLLEESQKSDRNGNIISIGFAAIILGLVIIATIQNAEISKSDKLKLKIESQKEEIDWLERKIQDLKNKEAMQNWCQELAEASGKQFYVSFGSCRLEGNEQIRLDNITEISDSIRHYQLGSKK